MPTAPCTYVFDCTPLHAQDLQATAHTKITPPSNIKGHMMRDQGLAKFEGRRREVREEVGHYLREKRENWSCCFLGLFLWLSGSRKQERTRVKGFFLGFVVLFKRKGERSREGGDKGRVMVAPFGSLVDLFFVSFVNCTFLLLSGSPHFVNLDF